MCGIAGLLGFNLLQSKLKIKSLLSSMASSLQHRGPDSNGIFTSDEDQIGLVHTRLSIQDLSNSGSQPMHSWDKRFVLSFNGEIYNHKNLRSIIKDYPFQGTSDTETLVALISTIGLKNTLEKVSGMFAFALWDSFEKKLYLTRDLAGEKPLYYSIKKNYLIFGSEIKPLKLDPQFNSKISKSALHNYFKFGYVQDSTCIFSDIKKIKPGTYQIFSLENDILHKLDEISFYKLSDENCRFFKNKSIINYQDLFEKLIFESVESQLLSDAPIGLFLSGGLDSSLIAAVAQSISSRPIKTFSIGFESREFDESKRASKIAKYLGTNHENFIMRPNHVHEMLSLIPKIYDEPFGDPSLVPTYYVSKLASKSVKSVLTGDGADELFGGYNRYTLTNYYSKYLFNTPTFLRHTFLTLLKSLSSIAFKASYLSSGNKLISDKQLNKIQKINSALSSKDMNDLYYLLAERNKNDTVFSSNFTSNKNFLKKSTNYLSSIEEFMIFDLKTYLPGSILTKVDRACMNVSLENRSPYLDKKIINLAMSMPLKYKINGKIGKLPIRNLLSKFLPKEMFTYNKSGFGFPLSKWLRGELKDWIYSLLLDKSNFNYEIFNYNEVYNKLNDHMNYKNDNSDLLWCLAMFKIWEEQNI